MPGLFWESNTCHCAAGHPGRLAGRLPSVCESEMPAALADPRTKDFPQLVVIHHTNCVFSHPPCRRRALTPVGMCGVEQTIFCAMRASAPTAPEQWHIIALDAAPHPYLPWDVHVQHQARKGSFLPGLLFWLPAGPCSVILCIVSAHLLARAARRLPAIPAGSPQPEYFS